MTKYLLAPLLLTLCACASADDEGVRWKPQRNTIDVIETPEGLVAIPPACPSFNDPGALDRMENDPMPQLGCATANNLAAQIVNPADLVRGELYTDRTAPSNGTVGANAIKRYHEGKVYVPTLTPAVTEGGK